MIARPSWFSRDPGELQFMHAEQEALRRGRCPCCNHESAPFLRARDGMYVCSRCVAYAYRDHDSGRLMYGEDRRRGPA